MPILPETELRARDAQRDLNAELLEAVQQMRAGQLGRVSVLTRDKRVIDSPIAKIRVSTNLSQAKFATLMGISVRTLQDWEQGRRSPSGAAKTLLRVAEKHPEILLEAIESNPVA